MQKLNSLIEKKYQNSFLNNKEVFKILKKKIYLINKIQNSLEVKKMKYNRNNFHVNNYFLYLIDKKKLTQKEMDNILSFYKKFSVQLKDNKETINVTGKNGVKINSSSRPKKLISSLQKSLDFYRYIFFLWLHNFKFYII